MLPLCHKLFYNSCTTVEKPLKILLDKKCSKERKAGRFATGNYSKSWGIYRKLTDNSCATVKPKSKLEHICTIFYYSLTQKFFLIYWILYWHVVCFLFLHSEVPKGCKWSFIACFLSICIFFLLILFIIQWQFFMLALVRKSLLLMSVKPSKLQEAWYNLYRKMLVGLL